MVAHKIVPPLSTGDSTGSTATNFKLGFSGFKNWEAGEWEGSVYIHKGVERCNNLNSTKQYWS